MNFVVLAIPLFLILILIEISVAKLKKVNVYSFNDTINSINLGILSQISGVAQKLLQFSVYILIFDSFAVFSFDLSQAYIWIFAFVAYDFCYYWYHRMSHEINVLWAAHVVHHQSEEYNLSTALRQTSGSVFNFVFYAPLAIIGIDPIVIVTVGSLNLVYQFWVHTKLIDKMPNWYEAIFITPSNHRVHHAQNPIYLDKNHGGVFVIWDRLFGTYQAELDEEPVIFGVTKPLASWNPIWANFEVYWGLFKDAIRTSSWKDKLIIWFKPTGWRPQDVSERYPSPIFDPYQQVKFDTQLSPLQKVYVAIQHVSLIAFGILVLLKASEFQTSHTLLLIFVASFGLFSLGAYQHQQMPVTLELVKFGLFILGTGVVLQPHELISVELATVWSAMNLILLTLSAKTFDGERVQKIKKT